VLRAHWARFGRNFYSRHDYEEIDAEPAQGLMDALRARQPVLGGERFGDLMVAHADDFAYRDPVDGSLSAGQGVRVLFEDGARIVYRLSGTGTAGATLRVYLERYEPDPARHHQETQAALRPLVEVADHLAGVRERTKRDAPSVVT
jgi:phosphoglucomutase